MMYLGMDFKILFYLEFIEHEIVNLCLLPIWGSCQPSLFQFFPPHFLFSSVKFGHSVTSDSLWPRGLQHTRPPYLSPSPGTCSNSCPSSWWHHPTSSSSVIPFSCFQSFPASGSFPMSQLFVSGGQNVGASSSASVLPMNIQGWFPLGLTDLIHLPSKGLTRVFSNTTVQKHWFFCFWI